MTPTGRPHRMTPNGRPHRMTPNGRPHTMNSAPQSLTMEYNVSHLLKSPVGTTREYDLDPGERLPLDEEIVAVIEEGHVRLDRPTTGILARGRDRSSVHLTCRRCLPPLDAPVAGHFAHRL